MAKLNVGNKFVPIYHGAPSLTFEVVSLDRNKNEVEVRVTNDKGNVWCEKWDDLDVAEMAFEISEYAFVN